MCIYKSVYICVYTDAHTSTDFLHTELFIPLVSLFELGSCIKGSCPENKLLT